MTDKSEVFYMLAPFKTEQDSFNVGVEIMKLWIKIASEHEYIHPFGTIMSNHDAHKDFAKLAGITDESRENGYLVFIFRLGISDPPVPSLRIPHDKHLRME